MRSKKEVEFLVEKLQLSPRAKVLDVPCGTGRHAKLFAQKRFEVTAVDIGKACIELARKNSKHRNVSYQIGDMSNLRKFKNKYDVVLNIFSSFGYFATDRENAKVMRQLANCLKPGGRLVVNTINRDFVLPNYQPAVWIKNGDTTIIQSSKYDQKTKYNQAYICLINEKTGQGTARWHRIRLYSPSEIIKLMKSCGLQVEVYGTFTGDRLSLKKSTHPIYIGTRK